MQRINPLWNPYSASEIKKRKLKEPKIGMSWIHWIMNVFYFFLAILAIDAFFYFLWAVSGQSPIDGFYIGVVTNKILHLFI